MKKLNNYLNRYTRSAKEKAGDYSYRFFVLPIVAIVAIFVILIDKKLRKDAIETLKQKKER